MFASKKGIFVRSASFVAVLLGAFVAFALGPGKVEASGCRTDPIVVLTNGAQLQFQANISTTYANVQSVVYTVHGPVGSAPLLTVYTDNPLGSVETVRYYADAAANHYTLDTMVYTSGGDVGVTTSSILVNVLGLTLDHDSASGRSRQHLAMALTRER